MRIVNHLIAFGLISFASYCMSEEKLFGDESMKACIQGAVDAQLKIGPQAANPVQATKTCLCLNKELNHTVTKEEMDSANKGNTEALESKSNAAVKKCTHQITNSPTNKLEAAPIPVGSIDAWRKMKIGITDSMVRKLLGEPEHIEVIGNLAKWEYINNGDVVFDALIMKVKAWKEPYFPKKYEPHRNSYISDVSGDALKRQQAAQEQQSKINSR